MRLTPDERRTLEKAIPILTALLAEPPARAVLPSGWTPEPMEGFSADDFLTTKLSDAVKTIVTRRPDLSDFKVQMIVETFLRPVAMKTVQIYRSRIRLGKL